MYSGTNRTLVLENKNSPINLYGFDSSDIPRDLFIIITKLPKKGFLYNKNNNEKIVNINYNLSIITKKNYSEGISVFYTGNKYFFTTPKLTFNGSLVDRSFIEMDSFEFLVVSADGTYSLPTVQYITVKNVNDPTLIDISALTSSSGSVSTYVTALYSTVQYSACLIAVCV